MAWVRQVSRAALWVGVLLGATLIPPLSPASSTNFTVPQVSKLVATLPGGALGSDTHLLCLVRSEDPQGGEVPTRAVCYSNVKPTLVPPPPPPPYRPLYHQLVTADLTAGQLTVPLLGCTEFLLGAFATGVDLTIPLNKAGGTVSGNYAVRTTDTTAPFDCADGTASYGDLTLTPLAQSHDEDDGGCTDWEELGTDETHGGLRDPFNPWDFYDVNGDGVIDLFNDIMGVIAHQADYDVAFDRGPSVGPHAWNMTAPDGVIDLFNDVVGVIAQFGHDCTP